MLLQEGISEATEMARIGNGFLTLDTPDFSAFIGKYGAVLKQASRIPQQLLRAEAALKPYAEYLD